MLHFWACQVQKTMNYGSTWKIMKVWPNFSEVSHRDSFFLVLALLKAILIGDILTLSAIIAERFKISSSVWICQNISCISCTLQTVRFQVGSDINMHFSGCSIKHMQVNVYQHAYTMTTWTSHKVTVNLKLFRLLQSAVYFRSSISSSAWQNKMHHSTCNSALNFIIHLMKGPKIDLFLTCYCFIKLTHLWWRHSFCQKQRFCLVKLFVYCSNVLEAAIFFRRGLLISMLSESK